MPPRAFTLIEVLVTILIIAVLVVGALFTFTSVTAWARSTSDRQTLTVLNDALTRYKTQGGGATALTAGTNIRTLLGRLASPITWAGTTHQFLQAGFTYPARSLSATGSGAAYTFYRANTYKEQTPPSGTPTNDNPFGQGTASADSSVGAFVLIATTTTGYFAVQYGGSIAIYTAGGDPRSPDATISFNGPINFWSCESASDSTRAGTFITLQCDTGDELDPGSSAYNNQITSLTLTNFNGLQTLECATNLLTSLSVSGLTTLSYIDATDNQMNSSALNSLMSSLPDRTSQSSGSLYIFGNPGSATATTSIATAKNWTVN